MTTLALRAPTIADAGAVAELFARVATGPTETADEVADELAELPSGDGWLLEEDGALAGYATVQLRGSDLADGRLAVTDGTDDTLVERIERRARELRATAVRISSRAASVDLSGRGYDLERTFLRLGAARMALATDRSHPAPLGRVDATDATLHRLEQDAFAGSWGFVPERYATWRGRIDRYPSAPSFVARLEGEAVGGIRCTVRYGWSWISSLAVLPAARRRGIGEQLLRAAAGALAGSQVGLDVDDENIAARALYARLGFAELDRERFWERAL